VTYRRLTRCVWNLQADADHLEGTKAILRGLKTRFQSTGVAPILIHTVSVAVTTNLSMKLTLSSLALVS